MPVTYRLRVISGNSQYLSNQMVLFFFYSLQQVQEQQEQIKSNLSHWLKLRWIFNILVSRTNCPSAASCEHQCTNRDAGWKTKRSSSFNLSHRCCLRATPLTWYFPAHSENKRQIVWTAQDTLSLLWRWNIQKGPSGERALKTVARGASTSCCQMLKFGNRKGLIRSKRYISHGKIFNRGDGLDCLSFR